MTGRKDDHGKLRWSLLPLRGVKQVIQVLMHGANLYGDENWRAVEDGKRRYYEALLRHITDWQLGIKVDPKSGLPTLAHVACNALFLAELELAEKREEEAALQTLKAKRK